MTGPEVKTLVESINRPKSHIADDLGRTEQWIHAACRRGCDKLTFYALQAYANAAKLEDAKKALTP